VADSTRKTRVRRVLGALLIGGVLIGGAYAVADPNFSIFHPLAANAASTQELLKAYSQKDSDNDGLPDWQEELYGTDAKNPHSVDANLTDSQAVAQGLVKPKFTSAQAKTEPATATTTDPVLPGQTPAANTLTAQFSEDFFQQYLALSGGQPLSSSDQQALLTELMTEFTAKAQQMLASPYTSANVQTSSGATVMQYAADVEEVFRENDVEEGSGNPVLLMQSLIQNGDENARPKLITLATTYKSLATALSKVSVPPQLVDAHLKLMQSFDTEGNATQIVAHYEQDPIAVLGALAIYQPASEQVVTSLKDISTAILTEGTPEPGKVGDLIVTTAQSSK
jgi:hypothetical protein